MLLALTCVARVRAQDEAIVDAIARTMMAEDRRVFDSGTFEFAARHPNPTVRRRAALAIGRVGDPAGTMALIDLLADPELTVREDAAFALGLMADPLALDRLRQLALGSVSEEEVALQEEAVTAILKFTDVDASAFVEELLLRWAGPVLAGDEPPPTVVTALREAWRLERRAPMQLLLQYAESRVSRARKWALYSLGRIRAPDAAGAFLVALDDREAWVRSQAVRVLTATYADSAGLDRAVVAGRVADRVDDSDAQVRINALRALATFQDPAFASHAADAVSDRDPNARVQALATLGRLGGPRAAQMLTERVTRGSFAERHAALLGMARAARDEALIQSAAWITNDEWTYRAAGAEALAVIGGDTALAWSEGLTRDPDARVVARGLSALRQIDSLRAREVARDLIGHADPVVRTMAATSMREDPRRDDVGLLVQAYRQALQDQISDARVAVVRALAAVAELGFSERVAVEDQFLSRFSTSDDYVVRRAAAEWFPAAAALWGEETPVETGRAIEDYRDVARRLLLPAEDGRPPQLAIETERGTIRLTLFAAEAPLAVDALLRLADRNYFDAGSWHRVVPNFVIQDGDPRGDGWGGPGFVLRDELNRHRFETGTVGMALSGADTGGSQFFITHSPQPHLDGTYTVIGRVDAGMDVVNRVTQGDRIRRIRRR